MNRIASSIRFDDKPHRHFNPLKSEWLLVSPHRNKRPWLGQVETNATADKPAHDTQCYLCARNTRINGEINPDYRGPHVFQNDFPALYPKTKEIVADDSDLFSASTVRGTARVMCFSERHDLTLPEMSVRSIRKVVDTWVRQIVELGKNYAWVSIFENKGEMIGCSNPHPHGQVWASDFLPNEVA